ncbi:hypothetical protein EJ08DRAFT_76491 [Tothia fuscella]|uniref:Uncharacterized protein n=1 Tax=Tothia fuscella TaxID=1048955 RepID=A0A9P4NW21_9PEZI|nr:hypothetical protein EJ08DRAFT_76491 [Tothia fuscella]
MHIISWLGIAFIGSVTAYPADVFKRAVQDTPTVRSSLSSITAAVNALDSAIQQVTANNTATSVKEMNTKAHILGTALETSAKAISASSPLKGIQDIIGLMTPGKVVVDALNKTSQDIMMKWPILQNAREKDLVIDSLIVQKNGSIAFLNAMLNQLPASMRSAVPAEYILSDMAAGFVFDAAVSSVAGMMKGSAASSPSIPAAVPAGSASFTAPKSPSSLKRSAQLGSPS